MSQTYKYSNVFELRSQFLTLKSLRANIAINDVLLTRRCTQTCLHTRKYLKMSNDDIHLVAALPRTVKVFSSNAAQCVCATLYLYELRILVTISVCVCFKYSILIEPIFNYTSQNFMVLKLVITALW